MGSLLIIITITALQLLMQSFGLLSHFFLSSILDKNPLIWHIHPLCIYFLTSSSQRIFGLLVGLFNMVFPEVYYFDHSCFMHSFDMTCHPNLCALEKFIVLLYFIILSNSCLVFIRHNPFSYVEPYIFLKIFLSKIISLLTLWRRNFL